MPRRNIKQLMTQQSSTNPLPRWRGFNLLEMFVADKSSGSRAFREDDFRWIADWGFDFIRLLMSYHCWSGPERWFEMDETLLENIDEAQAAFRHHCMSFAKRYWGSDREKKEIR